MFIAIVLQIAVVLHNAFIVFLFSAIQSTFTVKIFTNIHLQTLKKKNPIKYN